MRPFGNDITNIPTNNGNGNNGNNDPNDGNDNRNNGNRSSNLSSDDTEESGISDDPSIPPHIARIGGIGTFPPIAGQGVIRVVQRCEDAKENHKLGKQMVTHNNQPTHSFFLFEAQLQLDGCEFGFSLFHL